MASYGLGSYWGAVVMRARRAASLALIAVVLIHTSIVTTGLSNTSGSRASVTPAPSLPAMIVNTGTTVASSRATETISWSQRAADPRAVNVSPVLGEGWDALAFSPEGLTPPDVQVAVGPEHVVEAVNIELGVYSKLGASMATYVLPIIFSTGSDSLGDPRIQYDGLSGRWFVTVGDFSTGQVLIAASKSTDPTDGWSTYRVPSSPTPECLDQPILGVGTLNVIVSVNVYSDCFSATYTYNGAQFWVVNKTDLTTGALSPSVWLSSRYVTDFSIHPVRMDGLSPIQYMVATFWEVSNDTSNVLQLFDLSGSPPGAVAVSETDLAMTMADLPPPSRQLGTFYTLDTADFRTADAVWSRGILWLGFNEVCKGILWTACVRLIELDTNASVIRQDFRLSSTSQNYFYPALAVDAAGNLALLAGYASDNDYPGLIATGRLTGDPPGVLQPPVLVRPGSGGDRSSGHANPSQCRYGDYFGASADPSDPTQLWLAGEFGRGSTLGWGTYISPVRMKAMLMLNYSVDSGPVPSRGPMLHFVLNGTTNSIVLGTDSTAFLPDPGTAWYIDPSFMTTSGQARYVSQTSDAPNLAGVANRSVSNSFRYQVQYPLTIDASSGGSVAYGSNSTPGIVPSGTKDIVYEFAGRTVNLTARPASIFGGFAGWSGDLAGTGTPQPMRSSQARTITAPFALNWALIAAIGTVIVIAAVTATGFLRRRRRRAAPPPIPPVSPVPPIP